jgi:hypothetical protein
MYNLMQNAVSDFSDKSSCRSWGLTQSSDGHFGYSVTVFVPMGVGRLVYEQALSMRAPLACLMGIERSVCAVTFSGEAEDKPSPQIFSPASPENPSTDFQLSP